MKKYEKINFQLILALMLTFSTYCVLDEQKFTTFLEEEITDYEEYLTNYRIEFENAISLYDTQMKVLRDYEYHNYTKALYLRNKFKYFYEYFTKKSNTTYNKLLTNLQNLKIDLDKINKSSNKTLIGLHDEMKIRKEIGLFDVNRLLNNFFNVDKTKNNLLNLQKILELHENKTALSKN
jgi:hypothetical protein